MLMSCPTCNHQEPASLVPTMSWQNTSYTYPSISLAQAQPVCSHCAHSSRSLVLAYPPRDPQAEQWFAVSNNPTEQGTQDRCHAFLHALLFTTLSHLREICDDKAVFEKIQAKPSFRQGANPSIWISEQNGKGSNVWVARRIPYKVLS